MDRPAADPESPTADAGEARREGDGLPTTPAHRLEIRCQSHRGARLVKVHIRLIRRRLGLSPQTDEFIRSVRGFGYMLVDPDQE